MKLDLATPVATSTAPRNIFGCEPAANCGSAEGRPFLGGAVIVDRRFTESWTGLTARIHRTRWSLSRLDAQ